ncbi:hypothetical protein C7964_102489 [Loktanella sp. PT4BL]|jgi:hypothetical protein|uniref:hypothetical protein n=1 Tax=Loktanella sp. PT4BL TaxID=2135611 RepID=UPI000D760C8D|nr:hypothetical protein [Loktanella sp. PT4BL]PXW70595.1 hypothetical protein C7964_102489 [Loktanella sp. PT4BL]
MNILKTTMLSTFTVMSLGLASASFADGCPCPPPEEPEGSNPGNAKPVGNSPWDGITGNSGNNNPGPRAAPMEGQRTDNPFAQPGDKGDGPSSANK